MYSDGLLVSLESRPWKCQTGRRLCNMGNRQTFLVHIVENQNATWQGDVTWLDEEKTDSFRSLLELIKLMDLAVGACGEEG